MDEFTLAFAIIMKFGVAGAPAPKAIPARVIEQVRHLQGPNPKKNRTFSIGVEKDETGGLSDDLIDLDLSSENDKNPFKKSTPPPTTFNKSEEVQNPPGTDSHSKDDKSNPTSRTADERQLRESLQSSIVKEILISNGTTLLAWMLQRKNFKKRSLCPSSFHRFLVESGSLDAGSCSMVRLELGKAI